MLQLLVLFSSLYLLRFVSRRCPQFQGFYTRPFCSKISIQRSEHVCLPGPWRNLGEVRNTWYPLHSLHMGNQIMWSTSCVPTPEFRAHSQSYTSRSRGDRGINNLGFVGIHKGSIITSPGTMHRVFVRNIARWWPPSNPTAGGVQHSWEA